MRLRPSLLLSLATLALLLSVTVPSTSRAAPMAPDVAIAGPRAAPDPPYIEIERVAERPANAELSWWSASGADYYEIHRGVRPYFQPGEVPGDRIRDLPNEPFGSGLVWYEDTGVDEYAGDGTLPTVLPIVGDAEVNYFWIVRSRNAGGEHSEYSNRMGEFDYALTPGS